MAVLLDGFIGASTRIDLEEQLVRADLQQREQQARNPLEPLLLKLAREFSDSEDLSRRLHKLYQARIRPPADQHWNTAFDQHLTIA